MITVAKIIGVYSRWSSIVTRFTKLYNRINLLILFLKLLFPRFFDYDDCDTAVPTLSSIGNKTPPIQNETGPFSPGAPTASRQPPTSVQSTVPYLQMLCLTLRKNRSRIVFSSYFPFVFFEKEWPWKRMSCTCHHANFVRDSAVRENFSKCLVSCWQFTRFGLWVCLNLSEKDDFSWKTQVLRRRTLKINCLE